MTPILTWQDLHDATLERLELLWAVGKVVLHARTGAVEHPQLEVVASSVRKLECDRGMPWGFSVSINEVRGPTATSDGDAKYIEIEMQSGDILRIEAAEFSIRVAVST